MLQGRPVAAGRRTVSGCAGCSCIAPPAAAAGGRLLLSTGVAHTAAALRSVLREAGATGAERASGMLDVTCPDPTALLVALRAQLSSVEAAEVRAVQVQDEQGDALLAVALSAPTLGQVGARVEHADLLPLFADELRAFRSEYQPIVALDDLTAAPSGGGPALGRRVIGYEALLRADGPNGPILPDKLFGAAEQAGWLHVLDRVGRTTALRGAAGWLGEDLLFVNFLPTTIYRPQVCLRTTEQVAREAGLRLDQLVFEVTESERVTDLAHLADVFAYYRERGCKVALDDLGAGYSSLNMLVQLQPDIVKLDKQLVQRLPDTVSSAVITAVVQITHSYGGQVLAECVETAEQALAARDLGVDLAQGWFFGRPQDMRDLARRGAAVESRPALLVPAGTWPPAFDGNDPAVALVGPPVDPLAVPTTTPPAPVAARRTETAPLPRGSADVEALLASAVQITSLGVTISDATALDLPLIYVNHAFEEATGYRSPEVLGRKCRFLQGPGTDPEVVRGLREAVRDGREHVAVLRNYRKDGQGWWNELRLSPVRDNAGRVTHYFGFQNDVTARVTAEQEVTRLAYHDQLTDLPNRLQLLQTLHEEVTRAGRDGSRLAVLFLDLDGFKAVNDRHGHAVGDLTLTAAAACLRGAMRGSDLLARYSGDEFVAVLTDVPAGSAQRVAQRTADAVLGSLTTPLEVAGEHMQLGASVGVALFPDHGRTAEDLLQAADRAMYTAKQNGRGHALVAAATHGPGAAGPISPDGTLAGG